MLVKQIQRDENMLQKMEVEDGFKSLGSGLCQALKMLIVLSLLTNSSKFFTVAFEWVKGINTTWKSVAADQRMPEKLASHIGLPNFLGFLELSGLKSWNCNCNFELQEWNPVAKADVSLYLQVSK